MDEITPSTPPPSLPFRRPADYYSSPVDEARPLFPRWVPYGCGSAAILVLVVVFAVGYTFSHGAFGALLDMVFASTEGEIDKNFTPDVPPADRKNFDAEMNKLREAVRQNRIPIDRLQPLLRSLRDVISDERVTPAETKQLTKELQVLNSSVKH